MKLPHWRTGLAVLIGLLPWLNPWTPGPSHALASWLFSWLVGAVWLGLLPVAPLRAGLQWWLLLLGLSIVSHPGHDTGAWVQALASVGLVASAALVGAAVSRDMAWRWIAGLFLLAAAFNSLLGVAQYLGWDQEGWINHAGLGQAYGHLRQRNQFATLTNMGVAVLLLVLGRRQSEVAAAVAGTAVAAAAGTASSRWQRRSASLGLALLAALLALGNALSQSRTGFLQLLLLVALAWFWTRTHRDDLRWRASLAGLALGYAAGTWLMPLWIDPATVGGALIRLPEDLRACQSRWALWHNVLELIRLRPLSGWGWGELDYAHYSNLYPSTRFCGIVDNAHNLPLQWAVELGLPWTLMLLGLAASGLWRARPWRDTQPGRQLAWAVLLILALHSMLEFPLWYGPFQLALGLCLGLLWAAAQAQDAPAPQRRAVLGLALGMLLAGLYASWDYWRVTQLYLPAERRAPAYVDNTLGKVWGSVLFHTQVEFAELVTTEVTAQNAPRMLRLAQDMMHYSPEPAVVEKLLDSALLVHDDALVRAQLPLFEAAFPYIQKHWLTQHPQAQALLPAPAASSARP